MAAAIKPKVISNPAGDGRFQEDVERHAAGADTPDELERRLRRKYPKARVFEGIRDVTAERWYAYREGRWLNEHESPDSH